MNGKRYLSVTRINKQERLKESKIPSKPLDVDDRPQTDNLLLSPEESKIKEKLETNPEKQFSHSNPDTIAKDLQNVDSLGTNKMVAEQPQGVAPVKWGSQDNKNLTVQKKLESCITIDDVPGPQTLKILSTVTKALPVIGMQTVTSLMHGLNHFMLSYGKHNICK